VSQENAAQILESRGAQTELAPGQELQATLEWQSAVDLDLHCFYRLAMEEGEGSTSDGFFSRVVNMVTGSGADGHIFWKNVGSLKVAPWIRLAKDSGKRSKDGKKTEKILFGDLAKLAHVLIVANIFAQPRSNFAEQDGVVVVSCGETVIRVPLTEDAKGSWCVVARIDNTGDAPRLINVNKTQRSEPKIRDFVELEA
jgi:uncharacterized protein involved in tellurium resistance